MWCSHSRLIVERALYSASTRPKPLREDSEARMPNPESRGAPFFLERPTNHIDFFNDSCTARRIPCKARWFGHIKQPSNTSPLQNRKYAPEPTRTTSENRHEWRHVRRAVPRVQRGAPEHTVPPGWSSMAAPAPLPQRGRSGPH